MLESNLRCGLSEPDVARLAHRARAFADHATATEDRERPARSIRDVVGFYERAGTAIEEFEDRLSPLGGQWLVEWETRVVFVEL